MIHRLIMRALQVLANEPPGPYRDVWKRRLYAAAYGSSWHHIATCT
jgi:hypothetical protein